MLSRISRPRPFVILAAGLLLSAAILVAMDRPPICTCGIVTLWGRAGPTQSQMLADWYSLSHIVHGFLFFAILRFALPRWPVERRFAAALLIEAAWEIVENTPIIIDRYREATIALGYSGDSILNSVSDIAMMAVGFFAARRLPIWASIALVALLELVPLIVIRDNLTLNVWMLVAPNDVIRDWQAGAGTIH
ncbi:MAG: DUF2585 domain-containing protein [Sphingomonas sp.]|uniref:DUF2585 family protein n=1 Tax=Sphingomonas sp. TaxID=28214 RepID=UPI0017C3E527|nr:DUF2585 family protein [Sphingomonas sp.]MBA3668073.1 DUF2585 domain-containing protein [Sphingomonas sp.]